MQLLHLLLVLVAGIIPEAYAHYRFYELIAGGVTTGKYQYVRANTNTNSPITDLTSTDLRCNQGGLASGPSTVTYNVTAGSTVGFAADIAIFHPGVMNVYLAKAPTTAASFDGSGNVWFRVYQITATVNSTGIYWPDDGLTQVTFTLPKTLPNGQYLMRIEQIALHVASAVGGAQFYISCVQINVTGGGSGKPTPLVALPGYYKGTEPGLLINIYWPIPTNYTQPGPALWKG